MTIEEHVIELKRRFLNSKASHQKYGEGLVTLAGLSHGVPWIEVKFGERTIVLRVSFLPWPSNAVADPSLELFLPCDMLHQ